ncbi:MAG: hypothetical protein VXV74_03700 [Pseudomonadota bacterium]|nr:hypothetical protein [Pseudomonadota bacterium]
MPTHYAASEVLILLVAIWTAQALWRHKIFYGALGIVLFGSAAAFGAVRFGFGLDNENLTTMHRFVGQFGGLIGLVLFICQLIIGANTGHKWHLRHAAIAGPAILLALFLPSTRVTLFLIWLLGFVVLSATRTPQIALRGPVKAALAGVMLVNVLVLRQASWLTPAESWHAFHFVVACWLLAIYTLLVSQRAEN